MEKRYTKAEFLQAAKLGEVSLIDAEHTCSLLDEARLVLQGKEVYEFVEHNLPMQYRCFECAFRNEHCKQGVFLKYPCMAKEREDGKSGYWRKK